ncbi:DDE Tnp 4 domain containing protein [Asbolus verrucosus]|uniref:DDE Tnp 4 domain containing protein n=1 Tax=Asbolus verrucosus TaxID=1661398 RepID=A0A482VIQ0_ASBVE|nr:DDE Tnp 4 domain containing protein [Asbolus verrucosus]
MYKQHVMRMKFLLACVQDGQDQYMTIEIWKNSSICQLLRESNANVVLLGDQGYGIEKCLMTPYRQPRTPSEFSYNRLFKAERVIIESVLDRIIVACFVLHNIAKYLKDEEVLQDIQENDFDNNDNDEENDDIDLNMQQIRQRVLNKRQELYLNLFQKNKTLQITCLE